MSTSLKQILFVLLLSVQSVFAGQGIDLKTWLKIDKGYQSVNQYCSTCHSLKVIIQSKATRQGWLDTIRRMQKEQGMPLLNKLNEKLILNYLAKNYSPDGRSRRIPLIIDKWTEY